MKDFDALRNIWNDQSAQPKLSYEEILKQVKKSKTDFANQLLFETLGMTAIALFFILIWIYQPFLMWTSHLSLLILILCCIYYVFVQYRDYKGISNHQSLFQTPDKYINFLISYRRNRYTFNTRKYAVYSLFIGIACALYLVEVFYAAPHWQTIAVAAFTIIWFIICAWLMRIYIRREQGKLTELIEKLEKLEKQFDQD